MLLTRRALLVGTSATLIAESLPTSAALLRTNANSAQLGVFCGNRRENIFEFERLISQRARIVSVIPNWRTGNWNTFGKICDGLMREWAGSGYRLLFSLPLTLPGTNLAEVSAGGQDELFQAIGRSAIKWGHSDCIFRPGWNANQYGYPWSAAGKPIPYISAYRRVVGTLGRMKHNEFTFLWSQRLGYNKIAADRLYPGGPWVDYIGMDVFNAASSARTRAEPALRWQVETVGADQPGPPTRSAANFGLRWLADFSAARSRPIILGAWGTGYRNDAPETGGGDDPLFIQNMAEWVRAHRVAYHVYWNMPSRGYNARLSRSSTVSNGLRPSDPRDEKPKSSRVFASAFRPSNKPPPSAVIWAAGGTASQIQAAVNKAGPGQTVMVPDGEYVWTETGTSGQVSVKDGITIRSESGDPTKCVLRKRSSQGDPLAMFNVQGNPSVGGFKFFGFTLEGSLDYYMAGLRQAPALNPKDIGIRLSGRCLRFQIYNNVFRRFGQSGVELRADSGTDAYRGEPLGVIYNNLFEDQWYVTVGQSLGYGVRVCGYPLSSSGRIGSWDRMPSGSPLFGQENPIAVFIEDNTFRRCKHAVAAHNGGVYKARRNNVIDCGTRSGALNQLKNSIFDAHGQESYFTRATRLCEIYENTISNVDQPYDALALFSPRGGDSVVWGNYAEGVEHQLYLVVETSSGGYGDAGGQRYLVEDQIRKLHYWGNTCKARDGSTSTIVALNPIANTSPLGQSASAYLRADREYFLGAPDQYVPDVYPHPLRSIA